jgi:hypothetical protein
MGYGIPINPAWLQATCNAILRFHHEIFEENFLSSWYPVLFEKGFMATNVTGLKLFLLFSVGVLGDYVPSENSAHISQTESCHPIGD